MALTFVAIVGGLLIRFEKVLAPLLLAFVLAYLFYPVASFLQPRQLHLPWRMVVGMDIYLLFLAFLLSLLTAGGVGLIQQIQNLVVFVQNSLTVVPSIIAQASGQVYQFGPFQFNFSHLDLNPVGQQMLGFIQPVLGQTMEAGLTVIFSCCSNTLIPNNCMVPLHDMIPLWK